MVLLCINNSLFNVFFSKFVQVSYNPLVSVVFQRSVGCICSKALSSIIICITCESN